MAIKKDFTARLKALEQLAGSDTGGHTYICDDGSEYQSGNLNLANYLTHTGYYTPDGRKLVRVKRPNCYIDPLSESLYQLEDEILEAGHFEFSEAKSDDVP